MVDRQHILNSIAAIARGFGRPPSRSEFLSLAGISEHQVSLCFPTWNDAVKAAGLAPSVSNVRLKDGELLKDWADVVRKNRALPSRRAYRRLGQYDPKTFQRFGPWPSLPEAFRHFAEGKPECADVLALLPAPATKRQHARPSQYAARSSSPTKLQHASLRNRATYGNPMHFRGLRHEPVNEQGVVLLFGMLANELGYMVEAVHSGFPDCEAKRQFAPQRWQRVRIEFEFESRNFRDHGHPFDGCDVIVCWRHNWDDCPNHIEILELSAAIKSLASSEQ